MSGIGLERLQSSVSGLLLDSNMSIRPKVICLTPVKNEAWILANFLHCASTWADHIIIADQMSDDETRDIARSFEKVTLINNDSPTFNEPERQALLIKEARRIPGPKVFVALDADEFFCADFIHSNEWDKMISADPGTVFTMKWACVRPDKKNYYVFPAELPLVYVDDGYEHQGKEIHSPRLPLPPHTPRVPLGVKTLHLSTLDLARFRSKNRWYQCWEFINQGGEGRAFELYRFYHTEFCVAESRLAPLPRKWVDGYLPAAAPLSFTGKAYYRWDREMLGLLIEHGPQRFRQLAIWDTDWDRMHRDIFGSESPRSLKDPRSVLDKMIHRWLEATQPIYCEGAPKRVGVAMLRHRIARRLVKMVGW